MSYQKAECITQFQFDERMQSSWYTDLVQIGVTADFE